MWLRLELAQVARLRNHLPWILAVVFTSPRSSPRFLHTFNIDNNHLLPLPLPFRNKFTKIYHSDFPPFAQNNWITIRDLCVSFFSTNLLTKTRITKKIWKYSFFPLPSPSKSQELRSARSKNFQKLFIPRCRNLSFYLSSSLHCPYIDPTYE